MASRTFPDPRRQLGCAIRRQRLELRLSQEALADRVGCHRNYVGNVERGEQNVTFDMLIRFCSAMKCTAAQLMDAAGI